MTLLDNANDACPVTIVATGTVAFAAASMTGSAGKVDAPAFVTAKIGQTSTRPDTLNFICVTLETNKAFNSATAGKQEQSRFTLTGLTGSQHKDEQGVPVYECPSNSLAAGSNEFGLSTKDGWAMPISTKAVAQLSGANAPFRPDTATGTAVFVMDSTGFAKDTEYVFAILMTNSKTASDCKTVNMTATGDIKQTAVLSAPTYARALIDGEVDGDACPLKVYDPGFLTKIVSSSTKLSGAAATMTVTLRTNVDLKSTSSDFKASITLSGLTGTKTDDSTTLSEVLTSSGTGNVATAFSPDFDKVKWTKSTGVLVLELKAGSSCTHPSGSAAKSSVVNCVKAGVEYEFEFSLTNGDTVQAAPAVSIEANYDEIGKFTAKQPVSAPLDTGCLADQALKIISKDEILCSYKIGQLEIAPGATNPICVTLKSSKDLSTTAQGAANRFVAFTITGLKGFATDGQDLKIRDTTGETALSSTDRSGSSVKAFNKFCKTSGTDATSTSGCKANEENVLKYSETSGEAEFYLASKATFVKDTSYSFCFHLTNPSKATACKTDISIKVKDSDMTAAAAVSYPMKIASGDA